MAFVRVSPADAHALVTEQGYVFVDVRSVPEFEEAHPAGAVNIPLLDHDPMRGMVPNPDFLAVVQRTFPPDTKLVLGCRSGGRSMRACGVLEQAGYVTLVDQRAGFGGVKDPVGRTIEAGWLDAGLPVETGPGAEGQSYASLRSGEAD